MIVVLTGATGFIGPPLIERLKSEGYRPRILGRRDPAIDGTEFVRWDATKEPPASALEGADAVIHLAGEPVAQRWNAEVKRRIRDSRVIGTRHIVNAMAKCAVRPRTLIAASAIGLYGDRGDETLTETSRPGDDFLSATCMEWESESRRAEDLGVRVAMVRIGIVLGEDGGALQQMLPPFKAGLGGPVGSGTQWVSWIHLEDIVGLILFILRDESVRGALNATSPNPVRNVDFAKELGIALRRPSLIPVPAFALKLLYGEMAKVVLASQRVLPDAATRAGYQFRYPELREAFRDILG